MTIKELLEKQKENRLRVINKGADLERKVTSVESTETPDVVSFLPEDTILITTGMTYKDDQEALCRLIEDLDKLPCAGLAIKLGRFIDELESHVIEKADELGFPLFQIPSDLTLGDVYHQLLASLWNDQNEDLSFALNTQKKFSNLVLQGVSAKAFLNNVSMVLNKAVTLLTPFGEVIDRSRSCSEDDEKLAKILFEDYQLYETQGASIEHFRDQKNKKGRVLVYPIKVISRHAAHLFIFDSEDLVTDRQKLIIEQITQSLGTFLYEQMLRTFGEICERETYARALVGQDKADEKLQWTEDQLRILGKHHGIKQSDYYTVILGTMEPVVTRRFEPVKFSQREEKYIQIYSWLNHWLKDNFRDDVILFPQYEDFRFIFLNQGSKKMGRKHMVKLHDIIRKMMHLEMVFSLGNEMLEISSISYSYGEAVESYRDCEVNAGEEYIRYFMPKQATELLKTLPGDQTKKFCVHTLKSLAYPKDDMTMELQKTLRIYLEHNSSVTETANEMFLHRNTIKYRIKKCEELLECDFTETSQCFQLLLALVLAADK